MAGVRRAFVCRGGAWIEKAAAAPLHAPAPAPMVRCDAMDPIRSMLDGRIYDSRSRYYRALKRGGAQIVGDERAAFARRPAFEPEGVAASLKQSIEELESR
ncbi:MAG TPA: hypothetical protein VMU93_07425 [Caulobacteraceae bacterium]|nr:hypothetical protein [Caulobacteraceae bacterium]